MYKAKQKKKTIFSTNSNSRLAKTIANKTGLLLGKCEIKKFADKEISVRIKERVKGKSVYVLGSSFPPADNLVELLILVHTLKVNGVKKINLVMPYFAYAKADHVDLPGTSVTAKLMAEAIELAGADKVITIDLHSKRVEKFFKKPLKNLSAITILANYFNKKRINNLAVASPDLGGVGRAKQFAKVLGINKIITIEKRRSSFGKIKVIRVLGEVKGKNVIIVDDMIQSGATIIKAVRALKKQGAKNIYVAVTHLVSSGPSIPLLVKERAIKQIVVTDTIPAKTKLPSKFKRLSVTGLLSEVIKN